MFSLESVAKILEFCATHAYAVFIMLGFALFIPDGIAGQIGIEIMRAEYRGYFGLGFLLTGIISIASFVKYIDRTVISGWRLKRREDRDQLAKYTKRQVQIETELDALNDLESLWMGYCVYHQVKTVSAIQTNVTANSLRNKKIVLQGSGSMLDLPFHLQDDVWLYLKANWQKFMPDNAKHDRVFLDALGMFERSLKW
jgi:hypothetical protein